MIIKGIPKAQKRHRHTKRGVVYDPSSSDKKNYLSKLSSHKIPTYSGAISMIVKFVMPYPKKYYRTGKYSEELKPNSPIHHTARPDVDNLIKFLFDVLQDAGWIKDDSTISGVFAKKEYGKTAYTEFEIYEIGDND